MGELHAMDATGLNALRGLVWRDGTRVLFAGVQPEPEKILRRSGLLDELDHEALFPTVEGALTEIEFGDSIGGVEVPGVEG